MPPSNSADDSDDELARAMAQSSPVRGPVGHKRLHSTGDNRESDDEDPEPAATIPGTVNPNITAAAKRFGAQKRLRGEQIAEVEALVKDPPALRDAKVFIQGLHLENVLNKIVISMPPWEPSKDLLKNIYSYAAAILLSDKLSAYKGNTPKLILFAILKKHRFDLPDGIEHNPANWAKVKKAVEGALTQLRSNFKKAISASLRVNAKDTDLAPKADQKNIFQLTQVMVENTQCEVNVLLCARVAVMRKHFIDDSTKSFWDTVDKGLVDIRTRADGDSVQISRAFRHFLKKDRQNHGVDDYDIPKTVDALQEEVGNIIDAGVAAASSQDDDDDA
ncbi:hypothetical protein C8R43DRAFT_1121155 [Mycena crocata]|nr:hypothetical protein C8R43DRAFT_1121149 [Mycena crocata]KAJ7169271.1 hypothetical protein C8R43DRAFT_1121155 [Mycena crocata]